MTHEEIIAGNRLIANFMEYPGDGKGMYFKPHMDSEDLVGPEDLPYHFSWDWLMPVVRKIEGQGFVTSIETGQTNIGGATIETEDIWFEGCGWRKQLENTYRAVTEAIEWININKLA